MPKKKKYQGKLHTGPRGGRYRIKHGRRVYGGTKYKTSRGKTRTVKIYD